MPIREWHETIRVRGFDCSSHDLVRVLAAVNGNFGQSLTRELPRQTTQECLTFETAETFIPLQIPQRSYIRG